jgi:hypothetical protein
MPWPSPDNIMEEGHLPTPFSAAEIRSGCPAGRTIRLRVVKPGSPVMVQAIQFLASDAKGADHETRQYLAGDPAGDPVVRRSTWNEFQGHASFPAAATSLGEEEIETPAGRFDCWRYTIAGAEGANTFWFAQTLPGMPVKVEMRQYEQVTYTMTMVENDPGGE